ncbi:T9SS type A sorting domain-containing protein, partial [Pontimicrobium sp. MEBiC01747]
QVNNLEPNTTYQIEFYDLPVRTHAPGRQTANLYYNTKVSFAGQEWNGPDTYYTDDYNYWHKRTMTFTTDATTTSTTLTLQFPLHPDPNNPVNDGYIAIDDIQITCVDNSSNKYSSNIIDNQITLYPNPTKDIFNIKTPNNRDTITKIEIFNIQGQLVMSIPQYRGENINISKLKNGIYFVKTTLNKQQDITTKIIKK